ncbi:MAG TPA: hypothetical protein VHO70_16885 [Chitinispirillaceae bacterium]|nr:hypothetical protein [Chitinispirillaceae bacterium]
MKKKIITEQELFIQVAAHGDAAAFFSLISPLLSDYFLKLCSRGDSVEESALKVYEIAETLFKKLQHAKPENFDNWIETEFASVSTGNSEQEVILDKNLFVQCEMVLRETQKVLFRAASVIKNNQNKKGITVFLARHKITAVLAIIASAISIVSITLFGYYGFRFDMSSFKTKQTKGIQQIDSTTTVLSDSLKQADSITSAAASNPPAQETKPTPPPPPPPPSPKPRPRVTYTPPPPPAAVSENEGLETYQSSHASSYDQTQQSVQPHSEKVSQSPSYSSQSQSSDNATTTSSYNSSGNSTYSSQQSTQPQYQGTQEQNQP